MTLHLVPLHVLLAQTMQFKYNNLTAIVIFFYYLLLLCITEMGTNNEG